LAGARRAGLAGVRGRVARRGAAAFLALEDLDPVAGRLAGRFAVDLGAGFAGALRLDRAAVRRAALPLACARPLEVVAFVAAGRFRAADRAGVIASS